MIGFLWREDTKFQWYNKKIVTLYSAIEKYLSKCLQIKKIDYLCAPKMWRDLTACNHLKKC